MVKVTLPGGVVQSRRCMRLLIVPAADALSAEVKIAPQDIDQVRVGQTAVVRFPAFNQRTTPELQGEVTRISADVSLDQKSGVSYYTLRINVSESELERLKGLRLVPGMPVETFIRTGDRTVISYLVKPLTDQINKTWRER